MRVADQPYAANGLGRQHDDRVLSPRGHDDVEKKCSTMLDYFHSTSSGVTLNP